MWSFSGGAARTLGRGALHPYLFILTLLLGLCGATGAQTAQTGSVTGNVVDLNNHAIGSATISILTGPTAGRQALSDATGKYTLSGLAPGTYTLVARRTGFNSQQTTVTVTAGATANLDFTLAANTAVGGTLQGTLTRGDNRLPVANATVTLQPVTGSTQTVTTGGDGFYSFTGLVTGSYGLTVGATGFATLTRSGITVRDGQVTTVNFQLNTVQSQVGILTGQVKSAAGVGIQGIDVRLINGLSAGLSATTNSSGFYSIRGIVPGTYNVRFSGGNFTAATSSAVITAGATTTLNATLTNGAGGGSITGTVLDPSGNAIVGARVDITAGPVVGLFDVTSTDGTFDLTGLPDGTYTLRARATGFQDATGTVTITNAGTVTQNLTPAVDTLSNFGAITGRITGGASSGSTAGATVTITGGALDGTSTAADGQGDYVLANLPAGTYTLTFAMTGQTSVVRSNVVVTSGSSTVVNATFTNGGTGGTLSGTVVDTDGNAVSGVTVTVKKGTTQVTTATTDANGQYSIDLAAGTYSVQFSKTGFNSSTTSNVVITNGGTKVLDVTLSGGTGTGTGTGAISITVKDLSGRGVPNVQAELVGTGVDRFGTSDSSGKVQFTNVPSGTYTLQLNAAGTIPVTRNNVVVTDGKTTTVTVTIQQQLNTSSIGGVVRNQSGLPIQGAKVTVKSGPFAGLNVTTGADGRFLFLGLPVGGYVVEAAATGFVTKQQVYFVRNGATSNLDFRLAPSTQ